MKYVIPLLIIVSLLFACNDPIKETKVQKVLIKVDSIDNRFSLVVEKLRSADSIVLTSHIVNNIKTVADYGTKPVHPIPLLEKNNPNIKKRMQFFCYCYFFASQFFIIC